MTTPSISVPISRLRAFAARLVTTPLRIVRLRRQWNAAPTFGDRHGLCEHDAESVLRSVDPYSRADLDPLVRWRV
jgi:hypothetical protein